MGLLISFKYSVVLSLYGTTPKPEDIPKKLTSINFVENQTRANLSGACKHQKNGSNGSNTSNGKNVKIWTYIEKQNIEEVVYSLQQDKIQYYNCFNLI